MLYAVAIRLCRSSPASTRARTSRTVRGVLDEKRSYTSLPLANSCTYPLIGLAALSAVADGILVSGGEGIPREASNGFSNKL